MTATTPANEGVEFTEDRVPPRGMEDNIAELVELYGGGLTAAATNARTFVLPLRRGDAVGDVGVSGVRPGGRNPGRRRAGGAWRPARDDRARRHRHGPPRRNA